MVIDVSNFDSSNDVHNSIKHVMDNYNTDQLFQLLVHLQTQANKIIVLKKEIKELNRSINEAETIKQHWKVFNNHLENNPGLKDSWDALCMGIKLTEK